MILEKIYLPIINYIYEKTKGINEKARKTILMACIIIEIISTYVYQCDEFFGFLYTASINTLLGMLCFAGIIFFGIDHKINKSKVKLVPMYLLSVCGAVVFISGIHHYITYSYMLMGLFICLVMPFFLIVWCDRDDIGIVFRNISYVLLTIFVIFIIANCILAPFGDETYYFSRRYFGIAADPNGMAKMAVTASVCSAYLFLFEKGWRKWLFILLFIVAAGFVIITASRTNFIALALICIAFAIILVKRMLSSREKKTKQRIKRACIIVVAIISVVSVVALQQNDNEGIRVGNRMTQGIEDDGTIDLYYLSSGRSAIWQYCISKTSVIGNDISDGIKSEEYGIYNDHAHNTVIEFLYRSGIFAGISFLIIELLCALWIIRTLFKRRENSYEEIFSIFAIIAFGIASLLDIVVLPFAKMTTFLFYICLPVVFSKGTRKIL